MSSIRIFLFFFILFSSNTFAIRPFVTDDARIIEYGQLSSEIWLESSTEFTEHALLSSSFNDWFEATMVGNMIHHQNLEFYFYNPVIQLKTLLTKAKDDGSPGFALDFGHTLNTGNGEEHEDASLNYFLVASTSRLKNDHLLLHSNLGVTEVHHRVRPFWGFGFDKSLHALDWRWVLEAYSGDPYSAYRSDYAIQTGFRWLKSHDLNIDLVFGGEPVYNEQFKNTGKEVFWVQLGFRISRDVFTRGGKVSDPHGGPGMF